MTDECRSLRFIENLEGKTYLTCSACMSVWADGLSWANANSLRCTKDPAEANSIVVLSCQVTDLAILNDLRTAEAYRERFPNKEVLISGCLAMRPDIELPEGLERMATPRSSGTWIHDRSLVHFEAPFWIKDFQEGGDRMAQGHLFREMYPLRIGKGCPNTCTYCTIRKTRGCPEVYDSENSVAEFLAFQDVVLVADNPLPEQVIRWAKIAIDCDKPFSIRNVEPRTAMACAETFRDLAERDLLTVFHAPVQSCSEEVLKDMGRSPKDTFGTMELAKYLRSLGTKVATNIIIDYKGFEQDFSSVYRDYDYVSWNPYWDGKWDRSRAEERFKKYFGR